MERIGRMSEQTIALVTGANKGIGYEIAAGPAGRRPDRRVLRRRRGGALVTDARPGDAHW
jgi:NAD(P)-dependent dehydrogenase (short-subunit alcohol dehydrogenase family)